MENTTTNLLIAGIGGQGVILASEIISEVAMACGLDSKKSEIHGMSQRGGIVTSHVRFGEKIHSPLIKDGEVDILLSFELAEAVRWLHLLSPKGRLISSLERIVPPSVSIGLGKYPEDGEDLIRSRCKAPILLPARTLAENLGNPRLVNTILLGVLSSLLTLPLDVWEKVIVKRVPPKLKDLNLKAFAAGREAGQR